MGSLRSLKSVPRRVRSADTAINKSFAFKLFSVNLHHKGYVDYKFSRNDDYDPLGEAFLEWVQQTTDRRVEIIEETSYFITARVT